MIQAIDTTYNGHKFRSRLEARWAVYFDALNLKWLYEHEGFVLEDGLRYLPDFYFPEFDFYAEIKPEKLTKEEKEKCIQLCKLKGVQVLELVGLPDAKPCDVNMPFKTSVCGKCGASEYYDWDNKLVKCACDAEQVTAIRVERTKGILISPDVNQDHPNPIYFSTYMIDDYAFEPKIAQAILKAKSARFEFGVNG